ncbi:hypothetical protein [Panacagrimonas sp.]|uniref:hypothetical protein n=1 Tax=Panacagrimonas sp. TaxID=2480088 RepID=UPI003B52E257
MIPGFREGLAELWRHADELAQDRGISGQQSVSFAAVVRDFACLTAARDRHGRDRWQRDLSIWAQRLAGAPVTGISARTFLSPRSILAAAKRVDAVMSAAAHEVDADGRLFIRDVLILSATSVHRRSSPNRDDCPALASAVEAINSFSAARRRDGDATVDLRAVIGAVSRTGLLDRLAPDRIVRTMPGMPDLALNPAGYLREVSRDPRGQRAESVSSVLAAYKRVCQSKNRGVEWRADPDYVLTVFLSELGEALRPRITIIPNAPIGITRTCELCFRDARPRTFRCARHVHSDRRSAHHERFASLSRDLLHYVRRVEKQIFELEEFAHLRQKLARQESLYEFARAHLSQHGSEEALNEFRNTGVRFDQWVQRDELLLSSRSVRQIAHELVRRRIRPNAFRIGLMLKNPAFVSRGGASRLAETMGVSRQRISHHRAAADRAKVQVEKILDEIVGAPSAWIAEEKKVTIESQRLAVRAALLCLDAHRTGTSRR